MLQRSPEPRFCPEELRTQEHGARVNSFLLQDDVSEVEFPEKAV